MSWLSRNRSDRLFDQQLGEGHALRGVISSGRPHRRSHGRSGRRTGNGSCGRSSGRSRRDHSTTLKRPGSSTADRFRDSAKWVGSRLSHIRDDFSSYKHPEYDIPASAFAQGHGGLSSEEGTATGLGTLSAARKGFSNYTPPVYDVPPNQQNTDSESERRSEESSTGGGSAASTTPSSVDTTPSSVGSQTPSTSNAPSVAVASAPTTSQDTDTRPEDGRKRKVQIPDKYLQPKQLSAFDDFPMEEKTALAKETYMGTGGTEAGWQMELKEPYGLKTLVGKARAKFKKEEDAERATGSEDKPPEKETMSELGMISCMKKLRKAIMTNSAYNGKGGISDAEGDSAARGGLAAIMKKYDGDPNSVDWGEDWKSKVKPPDEKITVALTDPRHKEIHKAHTLSQLGLKNNDGTACTAAVASDYYDNELDHTIVRIDPKHPLWPELSNPGNWVEPPDFEMVDKVRLQAMKDEWDKTIADGGTEADVKKLWEEKYGTKVIAGPNSVQFANATTGTHEGTMGNGQKVTMTSGHPSEPSQAMTVDLSTLKVNPFVTDAEGVDRAAWAKYQAEEPSCIENAKKVENEKAMALEEKSKAQTRYRATPWPLKSRNNATTLSDIPDPPPTVASTDPSVSGKTASSAVTSWNGYSRGVWTEAAGQGRGMPVSNTNAGRLASVIVTAAKTEHLLRKHFTNLGEGPAFTVASAVADSYLTDKEDPKKILSEIPNFLEKHGVITDVDTLSKLFNEDKSRALAHDGQEFKKWAYNPSWRPGTAKKLTNEEAFSRLATQAQLSSKFPSVKSNQQRVALGTFFTDQLMSQLEKIQKPQDIKDKFDEIQKGIEKKLEADPDFIPNANTVLAP